MAALLEQKKPELLPLSWIEWQYFCSFTFKSASLADRVRRSIFLAMIRKEASNCGVHFRKVLWCLRAEIGESAGRYHYHALITGLPRQYISLRGCRALESIWSSMGGGHADVRIFSPTLNGVDYILKPL